MKTLIANRVGLEGGIQSGNCAATFLNTATMLGAARTGAKNGPVQVSKKTEKAADLCRELQRSYFAATVYIRP